MIFNLIKLYQDNAAALKQPFNIVRNEAEAGTEATIYIYGVIDPYWGVSAINVIEALHQLRDVETLHVRLNTPGGSVFEGRAIMAALKEFPGKTIAHIDSLCASAGTSVALACNEVVMSQGAFFMIHNASGIEYGDKHAMRKMGNLLEKIEGSIVADYVGKTGEDEKTIVDWMDDETWFNADEALEHGFIDRLADEKAASNAWNLSAYKKPPKALDAPEPDNKVPSPFTKPELDPINRVDDDDSVDVIQGNRNKLALLQIS